jgi:Zn-dependent protease with chaperone function
MPRKKTYAQRAAELPDLQSFPKIAYKAFSYSGDEEALNGLRSIPGVPEIFRWIWENILDEYWRLNNSYNHVICDDASYATLHAMLQRCCKVLDLPVPELYVSYSASYNAYTSGVKQPFIVLHSSLVENFSPAEACYIIGHELGHIKARHVLYSSVAIFIVKYLPYLDLMVPGFSLVKLPLLIALYEWWRRAEMSCDRAGLLCVQDGEVALGSQARLCGRLTNLPDEFNLDRVVQQYHDAADSDNGIAKILLLINSLELDHPFGVARLYRLRQFLHGEKYQKILAGEYEREK